MHHYHQLVIANLDINCNILNYTKIIKTCLSCIFSNLCYFNQKGIGRTYVAYLNGTHKKEAIEQKIFTESEQFNKQAKKVMQQ